MAVYRFHTGGQDNWQARTGYRHVSDQHARFERPEGEPSILCGTLLLAAPIIAGSLWLAFIGG
jgi:hypothetical protein